jgi:UDP:flavonoid glycosyltransferase YjiC (YdhE family)
MTTLGHALRQRGHRVSLIGIADAQERVRVAGLDFLPIGQADYPAGSTRQLFNRMGELSGAAAFRNTVAYFQRSTAMLLREAPPALRPHGVVALLLNPDPAVPPVNTGWRYHPAAPARLPPGGGFCAAAGVAATRCPHHHPRRPQHRARVTPLRRVDGGDPDRQPPARLRAAIDRVWGDPSYRTNAQRLQQAISTGQPVL